AGAVVGVPFLLSPNRFAVSLTVEHDERRTVRGECINGPAEVLREELVEETLLDPWRGCHDHEPAGKNARCHRGEDFLVVDDIATLVGEEEPALVDARRDERAPANSAPASSRWQALDCDLLPVGSREHE